MTTVHRVNTNVEISVEDIRHFMPLLNPAPECFHGREQYIEQAVEMLMDDKGVHLAILGPGGIGKTSIALTILHDQRVTNKFQEDSRFVSCEGITSDVSLVDTLCAVFRLHHMSATNRHGDLVAYLKQAYSTKPLLLIIDNFETVWDVESGDDQAKVEYLLKTLAQVSKLFLIVTMRGSECPSGLQWVSFSIDTLTAEAAQQVFSDISHQKPKNSDKINELLQELDYVPLAIHLMARLAINVTPAKLLEQWRNQTGYKLLSRSNKGRLHNVEMSIQISLSSPRMKSSPEAMQLLSVIALLPGGVPAKDLSEICCHFNQLFQATLTLVEAGLAYYDSNETLRVLSPIRAYITHISTPAPEHLKGLENFYFSLVNIGGKEYEDQSVRAMLMEAGSNIEAMVLRSLHKNSNEEKETVIDVALQWTYFLNMTKPRSTLILAALGIARQTSTAMKIAQCLQSLGDIQYMLGNYKDAQDTLAEAQRQFVAIGDQLGAAQSLQSLGNIQHMLGNYKDTQDTLAEAQRQFVAIGNQLGAAQCLRSLGDIQYVLDNYKDAQDTLAEAQRQFVAIGHQLGAAQCLQSLGDSQYMLDNYKDAQDTLAEAQRQFVAIGDQLGAAQCLQSQGNIQHMLGNYQDAQDTLSEAQRQFVAIGDQLGASQCLQSLGNIQCMLGNYKDAQDLLAGARSKFFDLRDQLGVAKCLQSLGNLQHMLGNYQGAQDMLAEAHCRFVAFGDQQGATQCLQTLGDIQGMLGNSKDAQDTLAEAQCQFVAIGDQQGAAQCLQSQGNIQRMFGNNKDTLDTLSEA
ncbi:TPR-like protein [Ramaria rubella]|nr:TPR-like protein [Ramaria rubella]